MNTISTLGRVFPFCSPSCSLMGNKKTSGKTTIYGPVPLVPLLFLKRERRDRGGGGTGEVLKNMGNMGNIRNKEAQVSEKTRPLPLTEKGNTWGTEGEQGEQRGGPVSPLLRIRRTDPRADDPDALPLPAYATAAASGLDLRAAADAAIAPGSVVRIPTGIALEIPEGYEGQVRPRSGMSLRGLPAILGTIDSDYRGEVGVLLHNLRPWPMHVSRGDRIAQLVIVPVARVRVVEVDELSETDRGDGGFGSTGVA